MMLNNGSNVGSWLTNSILTSDADVVYVRRYEQHCPSLGQNITS